MKQATTLFQVDTIYSADCIEWCPFDGHADIFICGTYQVLEPAASESTDSRAESTEGDDDEEAEETDEVDAAPRQTQRTGRLLVFQIDALSGAASEVQRINTPAILDAKWSPRLDDLDRPVLAVADAKGHITIYALNAASSIEVAEETTLCLSLDFSHRLDPETRPQIIASLSNGSLVYLESENDGAWEVAQSWHAHDFEPWCATWDNWDVNTIWSGGDDLKLKRWDIRDTSMSMLVNKRYDASIIAPAHLSFEAGVTTITSSPHVPHLLAVGSYDENLRIYDSRRPTVPLRTIPLGGGIWRARFHPDPKRSHQILVACMHDGFKVVNLDSDLISDLASVTPGDQEGCEIVSRFDGHASLAYGADWSRLPMTADESLVATCSFYDHAMHVWRA